jgi:hypothetical protein
MDGVRNMTAIVTAVEIKPRLADDLRTALGQLACRFREVFEAQPTRTTVYGLLMDTQVVVIVFARLNRRSSRSVAESWEWFWSDLLPLVGGNRAGLCTLAHLLSQSPAALGFVPPSVVGRIAVGNLDVCATSLITQSARRTVYAGHAAGTDGPVVIKLRDPADTENEHRVLKKLNGDGAYPHVPVCLGAGDCQIGGTQFRCLVLQPLGQELTVDLDAGLLYIVLADVADALVRARNLGVAHRDVSIGNIVVHNGRGVLIDWHVSAFINDEQVMDYTGTRLFMSRAYQSQQSPALGTLEVCLPFPLVRPCAFTRACRTS